MNKQSFWVMNSKGGVGKTTLSVALIDLLELAGREPSLIEIDSRKRLTSFLGKERVLSFEGAPPISEIRKDPNKVLGHYDPITEKIEGGDTLLDLGANEDAQFLEYCRLSRLDEDFVESGIDITVFIPTVAENESVKGAIESMESLTTSMPSSKKILVLNERDGDDFDKYLTPSQWKFIKSTSTVIRLPKIVSEGWEDFQRSKCRYTDIIAMDIETIQARFGFPRPKAKRARGDMAAWFESLRRQMGNIIKEIEV